MITSIVRFVAFNRPYTDPIRVSVPLTIWTITEPGIYLIAACLLTLRPLITYIIQESPLSSLFTTFTGTSISNSTTQSSSFRMSRKIAKRLRSKDNQSDTGELVTENNEDLVPDNHGLHNTYVMSNWNSARQQPPGAAGIRIDHEFGTNSDVK